MKNFENLLDYELMNIFLIEDNSDARGAFHTFTQGT